MPTVQIPITVDAFIRGDVEAWKSWNNGAHHEIVVGSAFTGLVKPDLSSVPVGATIIDASLSAYVYGAGTGTQTVSVYRLLKDWGEGDKLDEPATAGESNWTYAKHDTSAWATAGAKGLADRATTASSSLSVDAAVTGWRTFSGLADDVQAWLDGDEDEYGWGLYGSATGYVIFSSSDGPNAVILNITYEGLESTRTHESADPSVVTWTHAATGQVHKLRVTGHPSMTAARGVGYESATIPCDLTDQERVDIQGAVVHVHSTGWHGVVLARPEPNEPLLVSGFGKWAGSLVPRGVIFADSRLDNWRAWVPDTTYEGDGITPPVLLSGGWYFGLTKGVEVGSYANRGMGYYDPRGIDRIEFTWEKTKANTAYGLVVYSGSADGIITTTLYTNTGTGASVIAGSPGDEFFVVALYNAGTAWTPTAGGEGIYVRDLVVYGTGAATIDTSQVAENILDFEVPLPYYVNGVGRFPFTTHTPTTFESLTYDEGSTCNDKFADLMRRAPIEYGWYSENQQVLGDACIPHVFDRPTAAAYMLRLADCPSLPLLEQATLDELTSGTWVTYANAAGHKRSTFVADTDPTHPLVALGIPRYGYLDIGTAKLADAQAAGAVANAENGRARLKGDVTTARLMTINGAVADTASVKCGEMCYVAELGITARIERIQWHGRYVTLTLDSAGYELDALLARIQ